ncbi:Hypothetical predicted protein [Marmota monax]|uniref:Uncharacterized protein n=1 Tax=Marmota monax TaxID=9995 RepID=A0A5E4BGY2_MARMO|nr:Hypothetical predicted protein [Marmota monax]
MGPAASCSQHPRPLLPSETTQIHPLPTCWHPGMLVWGSADRAVPESGADTRLSYLGGGVLLGAEGDCREALERQLAPAQELSGSRKDWALQAACWSASTLTYEPGTHHPVGPPSLSWCNVHPHSLPLPSLFVTQRSLVSTL